MPLNEKGEKIKAAMKKQYGPEKGESVFYASENKGTIKNVTKGKKENWTHKLKKKVRASLRAKGK